MSNTAINTAQNVAIEYEYAGLGKRIVAFLIDVVVIIIYFVFLSLTVYKAVEFIDARGVLGIGQLVTIPVLTYSLWTQIIFNGRTVGKFAMGIKVIKEDGSPVHWSDYLILWIFRLIDILATFGSLGVISIILTDKKQRLGDRAARTIVINARKSARVSHLILVDSEANYIPTFQSVHMFNDEDINDIKDIYRLAEESRDYSTLNALRQKVESLLNLKSDLRDGPFIRTVMKDYSFLTQGR
jgi:uncharacterized RDD family membrane protein YckC